MSTSETRLLRESDAESYVALRREMLRDSPWAFCASEESDRGCDVVHMRRALAAPETESEYAVVGCFEDERLIAAAGIIRDKAPKRRHIAMIWGVYVTPAWRGRGLGRRLIQRALETARLWRGEGDPGVLRVQLAASERSVAARALYESMGFVPWGVEPGCLMIDGREYSEHHMSLRLGGGAA